MNDRLYDNHTKDWTVQRHDNHERHGMVGLAVIDGHVWRFIGKLAYSYKYFFTHIEQSYHDKSNK